MDIDVTKLSDEALSQILNDDYERTKDDPYPFGASEEIDPLVLAAMAELAAREDRKGLHMSFEEFLRTYEIELPG